MIRSFGSSATADLYHGYAGSREVRKLPQTILKAAVRKLDLLNSATKLLDLLSPTGNRLEKLYGDSKGRYSIRINDQFRIVFKFHDGNAHEVEITDYH